MTNCNQSSEGRSALALVGGFEAYQNGLYAAVCEKIEELPLKDIMQIEKGLAMFGHLVDGLKDGLVALVRNQQPLTYDNFSNLRGPLDLREHDITQFTLSEDDRKYWQGRAGDY